MKLPRHAEIWLAPYLKGRIRKRSRQQWRSAPGLLSPITTSLWGWVLRLRLLWDGWDCGATSGLALRRTRRGTRRAGVRSTASSIRKRSIGARFSTESLRSCALAWETWGILVRSYEYEMEILVTKSALQPPRYRNKGGPMSRQVPGSDARPRVLFAVAISPNRIGGFETFAVELAASWIRQAGT
jgi:hypothetical protein